MVVVTHDMGVAMASQNARGGVLTYGERWLLAVRKWQ